ncbi:hypothetical protein EON63_10940 [archaeon]|nr:MAG: hypothetical protein EON63_10940 [archaeon]
MMTVEHGDRYDIYSSVDVNSEPIDLTDIHIYRGRNGIRGLELRVLSKQHSPLSIHQHCVDFLQQHKSTHIDTLDPPTLALMTSNLIKSLQDPLNSVFEEGSVYWQEILYDLDYYGWQVDEVVDALKEVSVSEVQRACQEWLYGASGGQGGARRLSVMVFGNKHKGDIEDLVRGGGQEVLVANTGSFFAHQEVRLMTSKEDMEAFKQSLEVYSHYKE